MRDGRQQLLACSVFGNGTMYLLVVAEPCLSDKFKKVGDRMEAEHGSEDATFYMAFVSYKLSYLDGRDFWVARDGVDISLDSGLD